MLLVTRCRFCDAKLVIICAVYLHSRLFFEKNRVFRGIFRRKGLECEKKYKFATRKCDLIIYSY